MIHCSSDVDHISPQYKHGTSSACDFRDDLLAFLFLVLLAAEYRQRFADADALLPVDFRFLLRSCSISALTGVSVKILLFPLLGRFPLVTFLAGALGYGLIISGVTTATVL